MRVLLAIMMFLIGFSSSAQNKPLLLKGEVMVYVDGEVSVPLKKAIEALEQDLIKTVATKVTIAKATNITKDGILVITATKSGKLNNTLNGFEAHSVYTKNIRGKKLVVLQGTDLRGTIYAIYTFSEKVLGVPPLWYYSGWQAAKKSELVIPDNLNISMASPEVKYRAIFPNDMDLLTPWRKESKTNDVIWLETALRLKYNTIEWHDGYGIDVEVDKGFKVSHTSKLISSYGLANTTHHHSPLNASFRQWDNYWKKVRDTIPPVLSLANEKYFDEFWSYFINGIHQSGIEMLWVIGFRGAGDHPFWYTFKDAPTSAKDRGEVISKMLKRQHDLVKKITGKKDIPFRTIFYDELSDLLAEGYVQPPQDENLVWTYVAARRDHYPNNDVQNMQPQNGHKTGYYFNYQFTSTGSHLAAGEGPWKMEQNYRFIKQKNKAPLEFSVVNAGNIREFVMELSANAAMMWSFDNYSSDKFVLEFCKQYFGEKNAASIASIYKQYYYAYWQPKQSELPNFDRQFVFQDLRYKRAIQGITTTYNKYSDAPLKDHGGEQLAGRTYRIVPADNNATTQIQAIINGTNKSSENFKTALNNAEQVIPELSSNCIPFFKDNLVMPIQFMLCLNNSLNYLAQSYSEKGQPQRKELLVQSIQSLQQAKQALWSTQQLPFQNWLKADKIFGMDTLINGLEGLNK